MAKETFLSFSNKTITQLIPKLKKLREELKRNQTISLALEANTKRLAAAQAELERINEKTALSTRAVSDAQERLNNARSRAQDLSSDLQKKLQNELDVKKQIQANNKKLNSSSGGGTSFLTKLISASKMFGKFTTIGRWLSVFSIVKKIAGTLLSIPVKMAKGLFFAFKKVGAWLGKVITNGIGFYVGRLIWALQNSLISLVRYGFSLIPKSLNLAGARQKDLSFFNMLLGTPEAAEDMMKQVERFAAKTPLNLVQSRGAFGKIMQQLIGAGKDPQRTAGILRTFGDAVNGDMQRFNRVVYTMGTVIAKGFADNIDFKELANSLVNLKPIIAKMRGTSVEGLKDSRITSDEMLKAFQILTGKNGLMYKAMENQMTTWQGLISNLRDIYEFGLTAMGGPLAATIGSKIPLLTNELSGAKGGFTDLGKGLSQVFLIAWRTIARALGIKGGGLGGILSGMGKWARRIALVIEDLISWARGAPSAFKNKFGSFLNFILSTAGRIIRPMFAAVGDFLAAVLEYAMREVFGGMNFLGIGVDPNKKGSTPIDKFLKTKNKVGKNVRSSLNQWGIRTDDGRPLSDYHRARFVENLFMSHKMMKKFGLDPKQWRHKGYRKDLEKLLEYQQRVKGSKRLLKEYGIFEDTQRIYNDKREEMGIPGSLGASVRINQNNTIYTNDASRDIQQALITSARQVETAMGVE